MSASYSTDFTVGDIVAGELTTTSNCGDFYPWQTYPSTQFVYVSPTSYEPFDCIGKAHVFECEHEPKCKCGAVKRVMPRARKASK